MTYLRDSRLWIILLNQMFKSVHKTMKVKNIILVSVLKTYTIKAATVMKQRDMS